MTRTKPLIPDPRSDCPAELKRREPNLETEKLNREEALADQRLAARCLAGEVGAWEKLYAQCHEPLLSLIRTMWNGYAIDSHFVDEIAARVWYKLVADDGEILKQFDPELGRLITFMRALAKNIARREFRTERRRRGHEAAATRAKMRRAFENPDEATKSMSEFLTTLTAEEKTFCEDFLLDTLDDGEESDLQSTSTTSLWRWSQRIYRKLRRFLDAR